MFFFFKMCILLYEKTNTFWKANLIITLLKTLTFMLLICLWYKDEMKNNYDLLLFSENREQHLPVIIWEEIP